MQKERMLAGKLYTCITEEKQLADMRVRKNRFLDRFNGTAFEDFDTRRRLVEEIFEKTGRNCVVNKPFYCDYGCNISVGDNFYANYDCVILDVNKVEIGDNVFLAPRVCIYTAGHPIDSEVRNMQLEYGYPVKIGDNVWIGGNAVINPGVTIGSDVVIGSGSVVTHDVPSGVIAAGNPCKVIRSITREERLEWQRRAKEFFEETGIDKEEFLKLL